MKAIALLVASVPPRVSLTMLMVVVPLLVETGYSLRNEHRLRSLNANLERGRLFVGCVEEDFFFRTSPRVDEQAAPDRERPGQHV